MRDQVTLFARMTLATVVVATGCATPRTATSTTAHDPAGRAAFEIQHAFEADQKTVFGMWVDPDRLARWLGPKGAEMYFMNADVREGGTSQWSMTTLDGLTKYGRLHFKVIGTPHLLIYTQHFCDKDGKPTRLPIAAPYPDTLLTTVRFAERGERRTEVTVTWEVFGDATEAERRTFDSMKPIMTKGWSESFEKLEKMLHARN